MAALIIVTAWLILPIAAAAVDTADKEADGIEALIEVLQEKGIISDGEADRIIQRHRRKSDGSVSLPAMSSKPGGRQVIIIEKIADQVTDKVREEVNAVSDVLQTRDRMAEREIERLDRIISDELKPGMVKSSWARRIRFGGDIRLRYQGQQYDDYNADFNDPNPARKTETLNSTIDRHRFRYRARVAVKATILDDRELNVGKVEAGIRLATGNSDDPVSTNDTLGDYQNKDNFLLDRAYLKWRFKPELPILGKIPEITLTGGRMASPWFSTDLVWDKDLNFEGLAVDFKTDTLDSRTWRIFLTLGAFPLGEVEESPEDKWLYAGQVGFEARPSFDWNFTLAAAYYDFQNIEGKRNETGSHFLDYTAPAFIQKGNTLMDIDPDSTETLALASEFGVMNLTGQLDLGFFHPVHLVFLADYAKNLMFDQHEVSMRTGVRVPDMSQGYKLGMMVGYPKIGVFGDWKTYLYYKHLEGDAVVDAFTDSDFHLGGTNAKGWILGGDFGIYKDIWLSGKWITTDELEGPPLAIDVLQMDLNARF